MEEKSQKIKSDIKEKLRIIKTYIKSNGATTSYEQEETKEIKIFQNKCYDIFTFLKGYDTVINDNRINYNFFQSLEYINKKEKRIYDSVMDILFIRIMLLENKDQLINPTDDSSIVNYVKTCFKLIYDKSSTADGYICDMDEYQKNNPEESVIIVYNRLIKEVVRRYIKDYVSSLTMVEAEAYKNDMYGGVDPLRCIKVGESNLSYIKDDSLREFITTAFKFFINEKTKNYRQHLCFDCPVPISECPKIMDDPTKSIDQYPFIIDGEERASIIKKYVVEDIDGYNKEVLEEDLDNPANTGIVKEEYTEEDIKSFKVFTCRKYDNAVKARRRRVLK